MCLGVLTDVILCGVGIVICFVKDCSTVRFIQLWDGGAGSKPLNFYLRWSLDLTEEEKDKLQLQLYLKLGETIISLSVYWLFRSILHFCFFCDLYSYRVYIFVYICKYDTYEYQHIHGFLSSLYTPLQARECAREAVSNTIFASKCMVIFAKDSWQKQPEKDACPMTCSRRFWHIHKRPNVRSCCHSFGSNWHPFESPVEIHWSCLAVTSSDASTGHRVVERCKIQKVAKYKGISHDYFQVSNILSSRNIDMLIFRSPFAIYFLVWPDFTLLVWGRNWQQVHARHAQWSCAWRLREAF